MRYHFGLLAAILILLGSHSLAFADTVMPPQDYVIEVGDGEFVFVMLANPHGRFRSGQGGLRVEEIRAHYSQSGLYRADDPRTPLWTVNWHSSHVYITADGRYLVRPGPWPTHYNFGEIAVAFYEEGRLLESYSVSDLVKNPFTLPQSVSHYRWRQEMDFREERAQLFVRTMHGERYLFDVTTGEVIEGTPPGRYRALLVIAACLSVPAIVLVAFYFGIRSGRRVYEA